MFIPTEGEPEFATELTSNLSQLSITWADFNLALKEIQPSALKEGFATVPNVSFSDIGALDDIR